MSIQFARAQRRVVPMKIGISGPSGAGKTYSAILLAHGLVGGDPDRILVLDSENESAALYSELGGGFLHHPIKPPFEPRSYVDAIRAAVKAGIQCIVIDSSSHAWERVLRHKELLDQRGGNSFTNWGKVKPLFNELKEAILQSPCHVIVCCRSKTEYVVDKATDGKSTVRKLGMAAVNEPGNEYEYSVMFAIDRDTHLAIAEKDRTGLFDGRAERLSQEIGERILAWLGGTADSEFVASEDWKRIEQGESAEFAAAQNEMSGSAEPSAAPSETDHTRQWLTKLGLTADVGRKLRELAPSSDAFSGACTEARIEGVSDIGELEIYLLRYFKRPGETPPPDAEADATKVDEPKPPTEQNPAPTGRKMPVLRKQLREEMEVSLGAHNLTLLEVFDQAPDSAVATSATWCEYLQAKLKALGAEKVPA